MECTSSFWSALFWESQLQRHPCQSSQYCCFCFRSWERETEREMLEEQSWRTILMASLSIHSNLLWHECILSSLTAIHCWVGGVLQVELSLYFRAILGHHLYTTYLYNPELHLYSICREILAHLILQCWHNILHLGAKNKTIMHTDGEYHWGFL